mmetsp:Transcript_33923/g.65645  ORF Transcript_33923/g.65645 Transcript_33923/m.65645 type:complete len:312 (+) Transcript_33923:821-1756(+)
MPRKSLKRCWTQTGLLHLSSFRRPPIFPRNQTQICRLEMCRLRRCRLRRGRHTPSTTVQRMMGNGWDTLGMAMACRLGQMGRNILDNGATTKLQAWGNSTTLMAMSTKVSGKMISHRVKESTPMLMEAYIRGNGPQISKMDMVKKSGQMALFTKDNTGKEEKQDAACLTGLMDRVLTGNSSITIYMVSGPTPGETTANTSASGIITKCTVKACSLGATGVATRENMRMIKNKGKVFLLGQMAENIVASGSTANNMEKACTQQRLVKQGKAYGNRAKESNGLSDASPTMVDRARCYRSWLTCTWLELVVGMG